MHIDLAQYDVLTGRTVGTPGGYVNVLQVAASVAPRDGGPSTAILNINQQLRTRGSNSVIIATDADGPRGRLSVDVREPDETSGAATLFCRRSWPFALKNSWSMAWRTWRVSRSADIMHVHGIYLANSIWAYCAFLLTKTPYVLQPHGTLEPYQQAVGKTKKKLFNMVIGHRIVMSASTVIAASQSERKNILAQYPASRVAVVPLGVTVREPRRPGFDLDSWLSAPPEKRVIFLGRLAQKKRPDLLAKAWRDMPTDAQLLFVGPSQDWDEVALRNYIDDEDQASVTFLPSIGATEVAWCLHAAGIFVLPSENENYGIAVVEAMAYGCAIVSTPEAAATEHSIRADSGLLIDYKDANSLSNALLYLLDKEQLVRDMGSRGSAYARAALTWDSTCVRLADVYSAVEARRDLPI